MRKRRLVYVRDSEGKFARVSSLLPKKKPKSAPSRNKKLALSKPKRSRGSDTLPVVDIPEAKVSRGDLSYAIEPAKDLSSRYDLTGPDKAEQNQAAYREAKKIARELQLKYGDNAPSANLIYRVARNIQIGKFDPNDPNAAKPGEESGSAKPKRAPLPKPVPKPAPDPLPPIGSGKKREQKKKVDVGNEILNPSESQIKREKLLKGYLNSWWAGAELDFRDLHGDKEVKPTDFLDYFFESVVDSYREDLGYENGFDGKIDSDRKLLQDLGNEDKMAARMRAGFERWLRTDKSPVDLLKDNPNYYTDDMFEFYLEVDDMGMFDYPPISMQGVADVVRKDFRDSGFDGIKLIMNRNPRKDVRDTYLSINNTRRRTQRDDVQSDDVARKSYNKRIAKLNEELKAQIQDSTREELKKDSQKLTADYIRAQDERKRLLLRASMADDGDGGYLGMAATKKSLMDDINSVLRKVQARIDEIDGKQALPDLPGLNSFGETEDARSPSAPRRTRENRLTDALREYANGGSYESNRSFLSRFKDDYESRAQLLDNFFDDLKKGDLRIASNLGYADLSPEEKQSLSMQDRMSIEEALKPDIVKSRLLNDFYSWLSKSTEANDVATQFPGRYGESDYFDLFLDSSTDYNRSLFTGNGATDLIDYPQIFADVSKDLRERKYGAEQIAMRDRAPTLVGRRGASGRIGPMPGEVEPVEYRAQDRSSPSQLKREARYLRDRVLWDITNVTSGDSFDKLSDDDKEKVRQALREKMNEMEKVSAESKAAKPNRSRDIKDAKDFGELVDIMIDRNPQIESMGGWDGADGDLRKAMDEAGVHGVEIGIVLSRCKRALDAAERMADEYPEVPWDGLNAYSHTFKNPSAIAHCSRGYSIAVEFNVSFLAGRSPAPGKNADKFHPPNFENDPFYNVIIHEFGHSIDWVSFGYHDLVRTDLIKQKRDAGDNRDAQLIWAEAYADLTSKRDADMAASIVKAYDQAVKSGKHSPISGVSAERDFKNWKDKNTSGYAKQDTHELIAESWQDYHSNGPEKCSPVSKAVTEFVLQNYARYAAEQQKKKGK